MFRVFQTPSVKFLRVGVHTGVQKQRTKLTVFFLNLLYDFKQKIWHSFLSKTGEIQVFFSFFIWFCVLA